MTSKAETPFGRHLVNFVALGAGNYGAMVISMIINALLARRLGVEQFGRLALLLTTSQVMALVTAQWTQVATVRFGALEAQQSGSVARTFWTRLWIVTPWALALLVTLVALRGPLSRYLVVSPTGVLLVWVHYVAAVLLTMVGTAFQAREQMKRYGAILLCDKAAMAALLVLMPAPLVATPLAVLTTYATSSLIVATGGIYALGRRALLPMTFHVPAMRTMWTFASPLLLSSWAGLLGTNWFDLMVLRWQRTPEELGWYSLGTLLAGVIQQVAIVMSTLLLPQLSVTVAGGDMARVRTMVDRLLPYWLLATSTLFSLATLGAALVVPLVFGRPFEATAPVLAILMVASSGLAIFSVFSTLVGALGATWALTGISIGSGAVNVVGDLVLIPPYGILGAACATVLAYYTSAIGVLWLVQRRWQIHALPQLWLGLPVLIMASLSMALGGLWFVVSGAVVLVVVLAALVRGFALFRAEDTQFIRHLAPFALRGMR